MKELLSELDLSRFDIEIPQDLGPAPNLSKVVIDGVRSTNTGTDWEYIGSFQRTTEYDHGGSFMEVAVVEVGYGNNPVAEMDGKVLDRSKNTRSEPLCFVNGKLTSCRPGSIVAGYRLYWDLSGYQGGIFKYTNSATGVSLSTQIKIR